MIDTSRDVRTEKPKPVSDLEDIGPVTKHFDWLILLNGPLRNNELVFFL